MSSTLPNYSRWAESIHALRIAEHAVITSIQFLLYPGERHSYYYDDEIKGRWEAWQNVEEQHTRHHNIGWVRKEFPEPPHYGADFWPCRRLWALIVEQKVTSHPYQTESIRAAVEKILSMGKYGEHSASCSCKVPNNPWMNPDILEILKPLDVLHNPLCECAGRFKCQQIQDRLNRPVPSVAQLQMGLVESAQTPQPPPPIDLSCTPPPPFSTYEWPLNHMTGIEEGGCCSPMLITSPVATPINLNEEINYEDVD